MGRRRIAAVERQRWIPVNKSHNHCFVCGSANNHGLGLEFRNTEDGSVVAHFSCDSRFEGYSGYVHGGIVSSLLDAAMTNCMFALEHTPLTAELKVRFCHPLLIDEPAAVRAWCNRPAPRFHSLQAEIVQGDMIKARAWGKFLDPPINDCSLDDELGF